MIVTYSIDDRVKTNKVFNEAFELAQYLLKSVYADERPEDSFPIHAVSEAYKIFRNPTGKVDIKLDELVHQTWVRWHQVNNQSNDLNLKAPSNRLIHEVWTLLMAVQELNLGNMTVANVFAERAEIAMIELKAKSFSSARG